MSSREKPIRWIIFDLGGVVVDLDFSGFHARFTNRTGASLELFQTIFKERHGCEAGFSSPTGRFAAGVIDTERYLEEVLTAVSGRIDRHSFMELFQAIVVGPNAEMGKLIATLRGTVGLACYSNTNELHWKKILAEIPAMAHFERRYASQIIGHVKPVQDGFHFIARDLGVDLQECLFIDDNAENVKAAADAGMHSVVFKTLNELKAEMRFLPLSEKVLSLL